MFSMTLGVSNSWLSDSFLWFYFYLIFRGMQIDNFMYFIYKLLDIMDSQSFSCRLWFIFRNLVSSICPIFIVSGQLFSGELLLSAYVIMTG